MAWTFFIKLGIACKLVCSFIPYYPSKPWTVYPCDFLDAAFVDERGPIGMEISLSYLLKCGERVGDKDNTTVFSNFQPCQGNVTALISVIILDMVESQAAEFSDTLIPSTRAVYAKPVFLPLITEPSVIIHTIFFKL